MKVVAIIQARMGSTRLPGKVMMQLGGHRVLEWVHRACMAAPGVDDVWIATSTLSQDDVIADWCDDEGIHVWRGSETDVLSRYIGCAEASGADVVLRITGDCPFVDPEIIGSVVRLLKKTRCQFATNVSPRTYPDGLDVQAMTLEALLWADRQATRKIDRDGVCTWIERNRSRLPAETLINPLPGMQDERWVLDTEEDFNFCKAVVLQRGWDQGPPSMLDLANLLDTYTSIRHLNAAGVMNERYFEALAEEPIYERTYTRSQAQFKKASETIPLAAQTFSKSHLQYAQPAPLFISHGQGGLAWDIDGNEYVDLVSALLPNVLGYRDPDVDQAIRRQLSSGISFSLATELESQLADTLCRLIPSAEMVRFGKNGTDVTTAAIRLARAYTGRDRILICGGYHGWADWSVERNLGVPENVQKLTDRHPFGELPMFMVWDNYAACIVEPETNPQFLKYLREKCDESGTVLIFDEVITGFRFDLGGAQTLYGVIPDLATFGKAMGNGMPISAICGKKAIMRKMQPPDNIFYSGTMFGESLSIAAAIATLSKLERDGIVEKLWRYGTRLTLRVNEIIEKHGLKDFIRLSGKPSFVRLFFKNDQVAALFRREMVNSGTLITASHNISAAHGESEMQRVLRSYDHALGVVADAVENNDFGKRLAGASIAPMVRAQ